MRRGAERVSGPSRRVVGGVEPLLLVLVTVVVSWFMKFMACSLRDRCGLLAGSAFRTVQAWSPMPARAVGRRGLRRVEVDRLDRGPDGRAGRSCSGRVVVGVGVCGHRCPTVAEASSSKSIGVSRAGAGTLAPPQSPAGRSSHLGAEVTRPADMSGLLGANNQDPPQPRCLQCATWARAAAPGN